VKPYKLFGFLALALAASAQVPAGQIESESGAVGLEDRARMMRAYADYNLHLAFANTRGEFLAGVRLAIRDADGAVVWRAFSEGPYYFARLPEGKYEVTAEFGGRSHARWINVGASPGPMHYFHWK
jgi:hypothetical protein